MFTNKIYHDPSPPPPDEPPPENPEPEEDGGVENTAKLLYEFEKADATTLKEDEEIFKLQKK